jgi:Glycosyl hydrolase family 26
MSRKAWAWLLPVALVAVAAAGLAIWQWPRPAAESPGAPPSSGGTSRPGSASASPSPSPRMLLGTYTSLSGQDTEPAVEQREAAMGRRYDLEITYYNWDDVFPDAGEQVIAAHGRTVVMTWYGPGKDDSDHRTLAEINDGADDGLIVNQAEAIKAFGHRVFVRLMPEMNGDWYLGFSGNPPAYVAAWRRVHRLFAQAGVTNVTWVWCPSVSRGSWDAYYPGDAYVDVIGVDGFSNVKYGYQTFPQLFGRFLGHFAGRKPLLIVETATDSGAGDPVAGVGSAASFIDGMHGYLKDTAGPRYGVAGVCWFDTDDSDAHNWRVDQTPAAWQSWLRLARDPYFGGHG